MDTMDPGEQTKRVINDGGNDIFFVIAGRKAEWKLWAEAYMRVCDLEHRLDRKSITTNQFKAHVGVYNKMVTYRYLPKAIHARGAGKFLVVKVGTYRRVWSQQSLELLSHASQASFGTGYDA